MGKGGWGAIAFFVCAIGADEYLDYGYYTDATLSVLRQIGHSFGW
jgi:hypothetical protein